LGLDISRFNKKKLAGTRNACASIRIFGNRGDFVNYYLEDALIEGETIEPKILEKLLPLTQLKNKITLIYRDGAFRGREIEHLLSIAEEIDAKFILVECYKSGVPRLYNFQNRQLNCPDRGLALRLSTKEAIIVSTQVASKIGVPQPLRLKIKAGSEQISIEEIINITLKLTLLHHGSLIDPRLPIPLYGADKLACLRLQGIYPSILEGDRQFWL
jgi:argonaute-like protein implicated in RNA metabolism and viral defense